jgi:hypothetical protein
VELRAKDEGGATDMKIKITKGYGWYENKVGTEFDVIRIQTNRRLQKEYIVWEGRDGDYNWVEEEDCEIVEE